MARLVFPWNIMGKVLKSEQSSIFWLTVVILIYWKTSRSDSKCDRVLSFSLSVSSSKIISVEYTLCTKSVCPWYHIFSEISKDFKELITCMVAFIILTIFMSLRVTYTKFKNITSWVSVLKCISFQEHMIVVVLVENKLSERLSSRIGIPRENCLKRKGTLQGFWRFFRNISATLLAFSLGWKLLSF